MLTTLLFISGCAKWKVSELQKNVLFEIQHGTIPGTLDISPNENEIVDLTFDVRISNNMVLCSDNRQHRFQVFNLEGEPEMAIGAVDVNDDTETDETDETAESDEDSGEPEAPELPFDGSIKLIDFSFGIIGTFVSDNEGRIYVENTILPADDDNRRKQHSDMDMSPSYILVFNNEGEILYSLGKDGSTEIPFHSIYNMYTDNRGRLFVISKSSENWSVFRYDGKTRDFAANFDKESFIENDEGTAYSGLVENIIVFNSGNRLLVSVAYYDEIRFKYRKIYEYHVNENRIGKAVLELPDPRNELFSILEDKYIILWDYERRDLRFSIWNLQENIINNLRINLNGVRPFFEKVLVDETGRLYTLIVKEETVEIKEWK